MERIADVFQIRERGLLTVVAVNPEGVTDFARVEQCRNELARNLKKIDCETVRFDLDGIPFLASGILGLLVSMRKYGFQIQFQNVAEHIRDVLRVTNLDGLVEVLPAEAK